MIVPTKLNKERIARQVNCVNQPVSPEDLDQSGYLQANPDVAMSGQGAMAHFVQRGKEEGRLQYVNVAQVAAMRNEKLARLCFQRAPRVPHVPGQPIDFLTDALVDKFAIYDALPVLASEHENPLITEIAAHPERLCLDIVAGLRHRYLENVVNTEIYHSISTDVLCTGEDLPFTDAQFDYVVCISVLEHARRPWDLTREICRVIKPGGLILVSWSFQGNFPEYPHYYFNASSDGVATLFSEQCDMVSSTIEPNNHPIHVLRGMLRSWRHRLGQKEGKAFEDLTVDQFLTIPVDQHLAKPYGRSPYERLEPSLPTGSTLIMRRRTSSNIAEVANIVSSKKAAPTTYVDDQIVALEAELSLLRESRSWRLTAPLRSIRNILYPR